MKYIFHIIVIFFWSTSLQSCSGGSDNNSNPTPSPTPLPQEQLSDNELLDLVQKQTFKYFWDFAHTKSGLALERSNLDAYGGEAAETVTSGGSGFGVMAIIVGVERNFITRDQAVERLLKITDFLLNGDRFHGAFPHWYYGSTGKVKPFFTEDDGGDIVETSFMIQGLLTARQYFSNNTTNESLLRDNINKLWNEVEWDWYTNNKDVLTWHWSPNYGWAINHELKGYNEALITYVLAASSTTHAINASAYHNGWTSGSNFINGNVYYQKWRLPLGFDYGGPLFFAHYSFLGLDPNGLTDNYANYWDQNVNHTLINHEYCVKNPKEYVGYSSASWGLTASDNHEGYSAHSPTNDLGVISPTAALSSFPYTPEYSMQALRHFYYNFNGKLWGQYGFYDAFNETENWYSTNYLAIDQGPIIVMIENYRTKLLWNLFMSCPEVQDGLNKLNFTSPHF
ncbi:glucoamylase family protein [Lutibacter sp. B1]|uniref:glucoamylase family protein n=1 Tax=Lutibacter sp. B1 TaxID=2725996 RepID=UPI0014563C66|nr:glucoamylase family protein [Lutibacter sp. B1]NLP58946.1 beta-glucosidase [Lutibacter sp. B1]